MSECPPIEDLLQPLHRAPQGTALHVASCEACKQISDVAQTRPIAGLSCEDAIGLLADRFSPLLDTEQRVLLDRHLALCTDCWELVESDTDTADPGALKLLEIDARCYVRGPELGRGGMGRTIEAWDRRLGRTVAIKELLHGQMRSRFEREARLTARLQHPNIVAIHELGFWPNGDAFYSMRRVPGRPLEELIAKARSLEERLALLPNLISMTEAIAYAHEQGIVHRDLKPSNVVIGDYGETVVIDWGLAKDLRALSSDEASPAVSLPDGLTRQGVGTAHYMPPEQAQGREPDERFDVYALGATLYHLLAGHPPYAELNSTRVLDALRTGPPPPPPSQSAPALPPDLQAIVAKAMMRDPLQRYATAKELVADLRRFQTGQLVRVHDYSFSQRARLFMRRNRKSVVAAAVVLLLLAVEGVFAIGNVLRERDRANAARSLADEQGAKARQVAVSLLEEQGRQELLHGNNGRALAYLNSALQQGLDTPALHLMLGSALRDIDARKLTFDCDGYVASIDLSADGSRMIAACAELARVWAVDDATPLLTLPAVGAEAAKFSNDGRTIVTAGKALQLWDALTGNLLHDLQGHTARIPFVFFTPDDRHLVTVSYDGTARVWDAVSGAALRTFAVGAKPFDGARARLSADGKTLFTFTLGGQGEFWQVDTGKLIHSVDYGADVFNLDLSGDGRLISACGSGNNAKVWDTATGRLAATIAAHTSVVTSCVFSPDGNRILTTSCDGTSDLWSLRSGDKLASLVVPYPMYLGAFSPSPDSRRISTATLGNGTDLWNADTGAHVAHLNVDAQQVRFTRDGLTLISADGHRVETWDARGKLERASFRAPPGESVIDGSPDGRRLVTQRADGAVTIWDTEKRKPIPHQAIAMRPIKPGVHKIPGLSGDGTRLAVATATHGLLVIDTRDGHTIATLPGVDEPTSLTLDRSGRRLLVTTIGVPHLWDVDRRVEMLTLEYYSGAMALSSDGRRVLVWRDRSRIEVWDIDANRLVSTIKGLGSARAIGFDYADRRVAIMDQLATDNGRLEIWDADSGELLQAIEADFASFDADHKLLATFGAGRMEVWRVSDGVRLSSAQVQNAGDDSGQALDPIVTSDGQFVATNATASSVDVRSAVDGRVLVNLGTSVKEIHLLPDDALSEIATMPAWIGGVGGLVSYAGGMEVWNLALDHRSPAEVDRIARANAAWRVADGRLVAMGRPAKIAEESTSGSSITSYGPFALGEVPPIRGRTLSFTVSRDIKLVAGEDWQLVDPNIQEGRYCLFNLRKKPAVDWVLPKGRTMETLCHVTGESSALNRPQGIITPRKYTKFWLDDPDVGYLICDSEGADHPLTNAEVGTLVQRYMTETNISPVRSLSPSEQCDPTGNIDH